MSKKINIDLSDLDEIFMQNDLLDEDDWCQKAKAGKVNNCKKRMFNEWIPKLRQREIAIPSSDNDLAHLIISQSDYKNRKNRDKKK